MTQIQFSSPENYLEYLRSIYTKRYTQDVVTDSEFQSITIEEAREAGFSLPSGPINGLNLAITDHFRDILKALPAPDRALIEPKIAAGVVENGEANAFIARSPDEKYAIVFSSGLAMFLHKFVKLICALCNPNSVIYCNRKPAEELTKQDIVGYLDQMIDYFVRTSEPKGPMLKLIPSERNHASLIVQLAETFVLCHEVAHFLNGDLANELHYSALPLGVSGKKFEENIEHEIEYRADSVGYGLYLRTVRQMNITATPTSLLSPVILMFDLFEKLFGGGSQSHPHPHDRIARILHDHFDPEFAVRVRKALDNPPSFPAAFPLS